MIKLQVFLVLKRESIWTSSPHIEDSAFFAEEIYSSSIFHGSRECLVTAIALSFRLVVFLLQSRLGVLRHGYASYVVLVSTLCASLILYWGKFSFQERYGAIWGDFPSISYTRIGGGGVLRFSHLFEMKFSSGQFRNDYEPFSIDFLLLPPIIFYFLL